MRSVAAATERQTMNATPGSGGKVFKVARDRNWRPADDRASLVRWLFDATVNEMYHESKAKCAPDLLVDERTDADLREQFRTHMEKHWPEWKEMASKQTDHELLDDQAELVERGDAQGLLAWQRQQGRGR